MMKAVVVILNWNGKKYLEQFLPSVIKYSSEDAEIVVADNCSSDGSIEFLRSNFPQVKTIVLKKNYGYAGGYNEALKQLDHEYFILLNSDVEVSKNWIKPALQLFENNRQVAAIQPKILSYHNKEHFEYAGAAGGFIDKLGYPFCRGRVFSVTEKDTGQYDNSCEIFWASGACMFVRSKDFNDAMGFDPAFFAHMEEIDLCWRLKRMKKKIFFEPKSVIYHVGGGTLDKGSPKKTFLNFRNSLLTLIKNLPLHRLLIVFVARLFMDGAAGIKFLLNGDIKHCVAVIKAHLNCYCLLPLYLLKRVKPFPYPLIGIYMSNIVFDHFFKKRKAFDQLPPASFSQ